MPLEYALQHRGKFPDPGPWKIPAPLPVKVHTPLGIDALPDQIYQRNRRKPFVFNIMVVGETGLGKTTFLNTLFNTKLEENIAFQTPQDTTAVSIECKKFALLEDGVKLNLTVIETPGFGDQLNREENLTPIVEYIDGEFDAYLQAEKAASFRQAIPDGRIHALLYFIAPTGHALKELDLLALRTLADKVNVIPVIAKADTLTPIEKAKFKALVWSDIQKHEIPIYPHAISTEELGGLEQHLPFTVIGSDDFVQVGGNTVRGRKYRWGAVAVENEEHCDFVHLRKLLMDTCLFDLIETTHSHHYAAHRGSLMRRDGRRASILQCDEAFETKIEETKTSLKEEMYRKEEEMRQSFVSRVREKEVELRAREDMLIQRRNEIMHEMEEERARLDQEEREIEAMLQQYGINMGRSHSRGK